MPISFSDLSLSPQMLNSIHTMGFQEASPIQEQAIPLLLGGCDLVGQAQTGTGKTAAFAIPVIEQLDVSKKQIQAIVLCPTRELALQVTREFQKLMAHHAKAAIVSIYGGESITKQVRALQKRPIVMVGTPGRVIDMLQRGHINFNNVAHVVLDEADEMLDMGFRPDIEKILNKTPGERQTILFSATMSDAIQKLASRYLDQPAFICTATRNESAANIDQHYVEITNKQKRGTLTSLMVSERIKLGLVFCNTKRQVDQLTKELQKDGINADALHGGLSQSKRNRVMDGFRKGKIRFLIATDVAARGIDVQNIQAVFNYDLPKNLESYVHRIGRTGRAQQSGKAFTFIGSHELSTLKRIERLTKSRLTKVKLASMS